MQNTLSHLTSAQYEELSQGIQKILTATGAERIYCFGSRSTQMIRWSPFHAGPATNHNITVHFYDLLLVMPDSDIGYKRKTDALNNRPDSPLITFNFHVFTAFEFYNSLRNNDPFACNIYNKAAMLHSNSKQSFLYNGKPQSGTALTNYVTLHWVRRINLARQSYGLAKRAAERNERRQTLSHLYQSAVHACIALITLHTGHRQQPQALPLLLQYCDNFCLIRNRVFPCNTPEEKELLQSLEDAAKPATEEQAYPVPVYIIDALLNRVDNMLELAEGLYQQKTGIIVKKKVPQTGQYCNR